MSWQSKAVSGVIKHEFPCSQCGKGVYRVDKCAPVLHTAPKQWAHRCSHCKHQTHLTAPFPLLEYGGKLFLLSEHAIFEQSVFTIPDVPPDAKP